MQEIQRQQNLIHDRLDDLDRHALRAIFQGQEFIGQIVAHYCLQDSLMPIPFFATDVHSCDSLSDKFLTTMRRGDTLDPVKGLELCLGGFKMCIELGCDVCIKPGLLVLALSISNFRNEKTYIKSRMSHTEEISPTPSFATIWYRSSMISLSRIVGYLVP